MYGVGLGIVDAASNMQAVAVEHRYGRTILPSFHGAWTFGGIIGACYALAAAHAPLWTAGLVAVVPLLAIAAPYLRREHGEALVAAAQVAVPWRPIMLVGLGMVLFYMVDTAAQTWGPTFLDDVVDAPQSLVALATLPYLVASLVVRLAGDSLVARYGAVLVLRTGSVVASLALAGGGHLADLAGRGPRLHPARRRRLGDRAAELLGRGPDRRRRPGPRGRSDRQVQPVQLRRRPARRRAHRVWSAPARSGSASPSRWC